MCKYDLQVTCSCCILNAKAGISRRGELPSAIRVICSYVTLSARLFGIHQIWDLITPSPLQIVPPPYPRTRYLRATALKSVFCRLVSLSSTFLSSNDLFYLFFFFWPSGYMDGKRINKNKKL